MADMDLRIIMTGVMGVNMIDMNVVEAREDGIGELTSGTNIIMSDEGDGIIVDPFHSTGEAEVMTEVGGTRGGALPDLPAVTVEVDQEGITVDEVAVRQDDGGLVREVVHEVEDGVIIRMVEIEGVAVRLHHGHGIEAPCPRTSVIHMVVTIIVINRMMMQTKRGRNK